MTLNGTKESGKCPAELATNLEKLGAREIVMTFIQYDGVMKGNYLLVDEIR
jgi:imidazole glycerol phosphate synthase subunit HisF